MRLPAHLLRTLQSLATLGALLLAGGCGIYDNGAGDAGPSAPDFAAAQSPGLRAGVDNSGVDSSGVAGAGGRDPPTANGGVESSGGGADWVPNAVVERVVDGDTIIARIGDRAESVRLIGLDAPESVAPTRPVQCFGEEASLFLAAMLPAGTEITLLRDVEARDVYDRLLGYVVRSDDGLFVNLEVVAAGYAASLTFPPNDRYAGAFDQAEAIAAASGRGLWSACGGPDVPLH